MRAYVDLLLAIILTPLAGLVLFIVGFMIVGIVTGSIDVFKAVKERRAIMKALDEELDKLEDLNDYLSGDKEEM